MKCEHAFPNCIPTVGFSVQVVKGTSLTSIIGFVALIYFALCFPLSQSSQYLERRLNVAHRYH